MVQGKMAGASTPAVDLVAPGDAPTAPADPPTTVGPATTAGTAPEAARDRLHVPVMRDRILDLLAPCLAGTKEGRRPVHVDGTLGMGGHAEAVLERFPDVHLVGIDRDPQALALAGERLAPFGDRVTLVRAVHDEVGAVLERLRIDRIDGMLLDLGLSSLQIDRTERGFAYSVDAPLDMRMGQTGRTAADVVNTYPAEQLARILREYGEERFADRIARRVVQHRDEQGPFTTSAPLVEVIASAIPAAARQTGGHPAKRTFQALRIEVNGELETLPRVLPAATARLAVGGRLAVLAYHSLEDRLVKRSFAAAASDNAPANLPVVPEHLRARFTLVTRGAERPSPDETRTNPRAASARLRVVERTKEAA